MKTGPKTERPGEPLTRHQVLIDALSLRMLRVLGNGNLSKGIREAAKVAYERYQAK